MRNPLHRSIRQAKVEWRVKYGSRTNGGRTGRLRVRIPKPHRRGA
ncbi:MULTISPECIES: hypothetical protein [unclassified Deinococcus]|nr:MULTISPECIES: hypothetical protein [unclassified Deinococcus]MDK2014583.1 hypothetical protein [Deinococcus sp. 43]